MIVRLTALLALAALAACATRADPARDTRAWFYTAAEGETKLLYGAPNSDDVALMLACEPGSGALTVSQGRLRKDARIELAAGGVSDALIGENHIDELWGGYRVDAPVPAAAAVMQRFRRGAVLAVREGAAMAAMPATRPEQAQIERFFAACG